ncbi:MAG: SGNH/GDSL hydrolase family protein [Acidobacteria bacterium]|nr:SGNH/GDSL hydrolase family protein [Acidobacteriota bacterium]
MLVTVLLVAAGEFASFLVMGVWHGAFLRLPVVAPELDDGSVARRFFSSRNLLADDLRRASHAYDGYPWADQFLRERDERIAGWMHRYEPFRVWGNVEVHGTYINIDQHDSGLWRRTVNPCRDSRTRPTQVWLLGGSVVLGLDAPDFATIPSLLSQTLNGPGRPCTEVTNLSVEGYVLNQNLVLLTQLLKGGHRPEIVVFSGGPNEAYSGIYSPGLASAHPDLLEMRARTDHDIYWPGLIDRVHLLRVARGVVTRTIGPPTLLTADRQGEPVAADWSEGAIRTKVTETLDNYEANIAMIRTLGAAYGFKAYFFWQPNMRFGSRARTRFERAYLQSPEFSDPDEDRAMDAAYAEAERRAARTGSFVFLGHVFDGVEEPIYVDEVHFGPRGNAIMADAVAQRLRP